MRLPTIHRRGVLPALVLLALVIVGSGMQIAFGSSRGSRGSLPPQPAATPAPAAREAAGVVRSLDAVQRAFNAGDLRRLCRPGRLVDPALIRRENAHGPGCEAELEALMEHAAPLRLSVRSVALRGDLATVTFTTAHGHGAMVAMVRRGPRWLLSFSNGGDPMPVLAGTD